MSGRPELGQPAPVVLFAYDRPTHTRRTLEALSSNDLASRTPIHVFCDGPKDSATEADRRRIQEVREVVRSRDWCGGVVIHERESNLGLARSIRSGIDEMFDTCDRLIILEDDIETSPGFLKFMNDALEIYANDERVMHIGAYLPVTSHHHLLPDTFLARYMGCWGWATWKRAWSEARWDASQLLREITESAGGRAKFDLGGTAPFSAHLEGNVSGRMSTWAVLWSASIHLRGGLCLVPGRSLVRNIGVDGSGVHFATSTTKYDVELAPAVEVRRQPIRESRRGAFYLRSFFRYGRQSTLGKRARVRLTSLGARVRARLR